MGIIAAFTAIPSAAAGIAIEQWTQQPGIPNSGVFGAAVIDIDGDGQNEAIYSTYFHPTPALGIIGAGAEGLVADRLVPLERDAVGPLVVGNVDGQPRVLVVTLLSDAPTYPPRYMALEFTGRPLREIRRTELPGELYPRALADVDADGKPEIVGLYRSAGYDPINLAILDHETLAIEWSDDAQAENTIVAQLDSDPALEIVASGYPGRIIDGATHLQEWSYPAGFDNILFAGEFDVSASSREFLGIRGFNSAMVTLFRTMPFSPLREMSTSAFDLQYSTAVDIDLDGLDEIVFPRTYENDGPVAFTPANGAVRRFPKANISANAVVGGLLAGSQIPGLVLMDREGWFNPDTPLRVINGDTGDVRYSATRSFGPYAALAEGDFDADGTREFVHGARQPVPAISSRVLCKRDLRTGHGQGCLTLAVEAAEALRVPPVVGRFDATPGDDIVQLMGNTVVARSGRNFESLWERSDLSEQYGFSGGSSMQYNADAIDDVVLLDAGGKITVLNGLDGSTLWTSVTLGGNGTPTRLLIADIDADAADEIIVASGYDLYAFDASTRLLEWSYSSDASIDLILHAGAAGNDCRLGLYNEHGKFRLLRCDDRSIVGPDRVVPLHANMVRALDESGESLLFAAGGRLQTVDAHGTTVVWTDFLGPALGMGNAAIVGARSLRHFDVTVGSDAFITRMRINLDGVFVNDFE